MVIEFAEIGTKIVLADLDNITETVYGNIVSMQKIRQKFF
jgi:hypothetical protein